MIMKNMQIPSDILVLYVIALGLLSLSLFSDEGAAASWGFTDWEKVFFVVWGLVCLLIYNEYHNLVSAGMMLSVWVGSRCMYLESSGVAEKMGWLFFGSLFFMIFLIVLKKLWNSFVSSVRWHGSQMPKVFIDSGERRSVVPNVMETLKYSLVGDSRTLWRELVVCGDYHNAWIVLNHIIDSGQGAWLVELELEEWVLDPISGIRYEVFRAWVWDSQGVWLIDSWSLCVAPKFPDFAANNPFSMDKSHPVLVDKFWMVDVEFASFGRDHDSFTLFPYRLNFFSSDGSVSNSQHVGGPGEILSALVKFLISLSIWIETSGGSEPGVYGEDGIVIFIPSPGAMVCLKHAIHKNVVLLVKSGIWVEANLKSCGERSVQCFVFVLPSGIKFTLEGFEVPNDLHKVNLGKWVG